MRGGFASGWTASRGIAAGWIASCWIASGLGVGLSAACAVAPGTGVEPGTESAREAAPAAPARGSDDAAQGRSGGGPFPSPEQLEELEEAPVPEDLFELEMREVDRWTLAGPFPERVEATPYGREGPWSALLDDVARRRAGLLVPTEAMYCVAREIGRFYLAQGGQPSDGLRRFITTRCNATVARVGIGYVDGQISRRVGETQIYGRVRDAVIETIESNVVGGPRTMGIWFGREGERFVVMVAFGMREVSVEPFSPVVGDDGRLVIRGEVLRPAAAVEVLVNRGRYGVAECAASPGVAPPRFEFTCELDPDDGSALASLSLTPPDRLLASVGLQLLPRREGADLSTYEFRSYSDAKPITDASEMAVTFVDMLNEVRRRADLSPVDLDPRQSETATGLAAPFFSAMFGHAPSAYAELVILGMLAGWSVDGIVQAGHFTASWVLRSTDLARLLAASLEEPMGRAALLAPEVDRIAVGGLLETTQGRESMAAVFGTYAIFSEREHAERVRAVFEKLTEERRRRGRRPPKELADVAGLAAEASSLVAAGQAPRDALNELLRASVDVLRRPVAGWLSEVGDFEALQFPSEYLQRPTLEVAVAVTHHQQPGEPWGHYVVMLVVADPEGRGA